MRDGPESALPRQVPHVTRHAMPNIDFYVLSDSAPDAHLRHACRLAEQAVDRGQRVFIRTTTPDDSKRIDDLLWTFGDRSFLPHEIAAAASPSHERILVLIGSSAPNGFLDFVINLGAEALAESQT